jgi:phosphopantetheinyl transferase (holo-ACP synthase)
VPRRAACAYLATRFSAKEAFSKAIGLGMRMPMTWRVRDPQRAQRQALRAARRCWPSGSRRGAGAHVTVTDETDYAASFVVVETSDPTPSAQPMTEHAPVILDIAGTTLTADDRRRLRTR